MDTIRILCLAYSRKHGGRCVAGLRTDGGGWVRPVSVKTDGTLTYVMCRLDQGDTPHLLDVLDIPMKKSKPLEYQPENWLINRSPWTLVRRPATAAECAVIAPHIVTGPELFGNTGDRVIVGSPISKSLALIRPATVHWVIRRDREGRRKTRVRFTLDGAEYTLGLTDDGTEAHLKSLPPGVSWFSGNWRMAVFS